MSSLNLIKPTFIVVLIFVQFLISGCSNKGDKSENINHVDKPSGFTAEAQYSTAEHDFITDNKQLIAAAAYLYNQLERQSLCKSLYSAIRNDSAEVDTIIDNWSHHLDNMFDGPVQNDVKNKLAEKVHRKMLEENQETSPTLEQCEAHKEKILAGQISPILRQVIDQSAAKQSSLN